MQEWVAATEFWRKSVLRKYTQALFQCFDSVVKTRTFRKIWIVRKVLNTLGNMGKACINERVFGIN